MIQLAAVATRVRGIVADPVTTMREHSDPTPPWRVVAAEHTLPLVAVCAVVWAVLMYLFLPPELVPAGEEPSLVGLLLRGAMIGLINIAGVTILAALVRFFSTMFGGRGDFDTAYVLSALAMTPYLIGEALILFPVFGRIFMLAGFVYTLVLLYRGGEPVLRLPRQNRAKHWVLTVMSTFVAAMLATLILGPLVAGI